MGLSGLPNPNLVDLSAAAGQFTFHIEASALAVPEPGGAALLSLGLIALIGRRAAQRQIGSGRFWTTH